MKYLVYCSCRHALDRHENDGCGGDGIAPCTCTKNAETALESAIEYARSHPWEGWRDPAEVASG